MGRDSELIRLEQHIDRLLQGFAALQDEKQRLVRERQQLVNDNELLRQQLAARDDERGDVSARVSSLIERIECWEAELASGAAGGKSTDAEASPAIAEVDPAEKRAAPEAETTTQRKQERDGSIQGSLFSG